MSQSLRLRVDFLNKAGGDNKKRPVGVSQEPGGEGKEISHSRKEH